jgi:hypothetical protein
MAIPSSARDTGRDILGMRVFTDEVIPNCRQCFVMSTVRKRTGERQWFAFCKKSGALEKIGPYDTFHQALRKLTLEKDCDSCELNNNPSKASYLPLLDKKIRDDMVETLGEEHVLSLVMGPLQLFVEYRKYVDLNFENRFGTRFFRSLPDDCTAVVESIKPCQSANDFAVKIQALAGIFDRINESEIKSLMKDKEKQQLRGSINILEQILKENFPNYPKHFISNLRNLMSLRSKLYPTHATSAEIIVILRNFGIDRYPLDDWEKGWRKILTLIANSLGDLFKALQ